MSSGLPVLTPRITGQASAPIPASAGIGLRFQHHRAVLDEKPPVAWLEVHPENYMGGGTPLAYLAAIRCDYPISLHGVGLSLGSVDGIDSKHLMRLKRLIERIQPGLVSEHLSWSAASGVHFADLLPLPLTEEALAVVCRNIETTQDYLGRPILIENPSSYLRYRHSTIPEWEFITAVARRTGCGILCDVNNIFVSASNHGFDPRTYLETLPAESVVEIHLAGHSLREFGGRSIRIDDHGSRACAEVWALYSYAISLFGRVPTLIEWDTDVPPLSVLLKEAAKADTILHSGVAHASAA
jgi:uncharacterized protein (UPF0276 family)